MSRCGARGGPSEGRRTGRDRPGGGGQGGGAPAERHKEAHDFFLKDATRFLAALQAGAGTATGKWSHRGDIDAMIGGLTRSSAGIVPTPA